MRSPFRVFPALSGALVLIALAGCFPVHIRDNTQGLAAVEMRQKFWVAGLIGDPVVDLATICPRGTSHFEEVFTPADVLYHVVTLGIYTPRSVRIECRAA